MSKKRIFIIIDGIIFINLLKNILRVPAGKNQTNSKYRGKGGKFDSFVILMEDRVRHSIDHWIGCLEKYSFLSEKNANY